MFFIRDMRWMIYLIFLKHLYLYTESFNDICFALVSMENIPASSA